MNPNQKIKAIIADDSPMFLQGVKTLLQSEGNIDVIATYSNGADLINSELINHADILLIDINMPQIDGINAAKKINFINTEIPMVAITLHKDEVFLQDIIGAGFKAFVYKPEVASSLIKVINRVLNNEFVFPNNLKT